MELGGGTFVPQVESVDAKLSKAEILRGFINDRLTEAAQEIFAVVERTITGYEEEASGLRQQVERQRRQMEVVLQPQVTLCRIDVDDDGLQYKIKKALPEVHEETARTLSEHLREIIGVRTTEDLLFVEPDDICPFLTLIQGRRLIKAFIKDEDTKSKSSNLSLEPETNCPPSVLLEGYSPISVHSEQAPLQILSTQPCTVKTSWISNFQIPWEKMPAALSQAIARGVFAQPEDRRKMIRIVVEAMREHCVNPNLAACTEIARMIVSQFPATFADKTADDEQLGCGYYSVLKQLKTRVEYVNRYDVTSRIRQPRKRPNGESHCGDVFIKRGRSELDRYGCINWQPTALPEGETDNSLEAKRQTMSTVFRSAGPQAIEMTDISEYMTLTYIYQRQMINSWPAPSLCEIEKKWPFPFTKKGLCTHFHSLTGVEIATCFSEALLTKGRRLWQTKETEHLLLEYDTTEWSSQQIAIAAILLVMKYFQEKEESIFIMADASSTKTSLEMEMTLPATPRVIMLDEHGLFTVCEAEGARGGKLTEEEEQHRQHIYAAGTQDVSGHTEEAKVESAENPTESTSLNQDDLKDPDHLIPNTGGQHVRTTLRVSGPLILRVCLLKDSKSNKVKKGILKSPIREVKCPRDIKEADFLDRLRSTFPQLTGPFEAFTTDASRKLTPLKVKTLTPEEIYKSIKSTGKGRSALYLRLKTQQQTCDETGKHRSACSDPVEQVETNEADTVSSSSRTRPMETDNSDGDDLPHLPDPTSDSRAPSPVHSAADRERNKSDNDSTDVQTEDSDQSLMESKTDSLSSNTKMNQSMKRAFLPFIASSAVDSKGPSDCIRRESERHNDWKSGECDELPSSTTKTQKTLQLRVCLLKDNLISVLAKGGAVRSQDVSGHAEGEEGNGEEQVESVGKPAQSCSLDRGDLKEPHHLIRNRRGQSGKTMFKRIRHPLYLRVCLLKDSKSNKIKKGVLKSSIRVVKCPRGIKEAAFLDRLRSTFPQLTGPFEAFTTDASRKLTPLKVKTLTPEEIYKSIRSTGKGRSALYLRLKRTCEMKVKQHEATTDSPSTSAATIDETRKHKSAHYAADEEGKHSDDDCKEDEQMDDKDDELFLSNSRKLLRLRVCLLKDTQASVLKKGVVKSPMREVKFLQGTNEADFLAQLRSTFPQLTGPFDAFTTDASRKLMPLKVKTLTPAKIYKSIKTTGKGRSALYIRVKPSQQTCEKELHPQKRKYEATTDSLSTFATGDESRNHTSDPVEHVENIKTDTVSSNSRTQQMETDQDDGDDLPYLPDPTNDSLAPSTTHSCADGQTDDSKTDSLSSNRTRKRPVRRSFISFLASFAADTKGDTSDSSVSNDDRDDDWKPEKDHEPPSSTTKTRKSLKLRVCLLKDTQTNVLTTRGYKYPVQTVRCPAGLQEESFLDLLRSTFPELPEGNQPFDTFMTDKYRRLQPLEVKKMTAEEICRSIKSTGTGRSALYIRLKETTKSTNSKKHHPPTKGNDKATSYTLSTSTTRNDENVPHASSHNSPVGKEKSSEADLQPSNSRLQLQMETEEDQEGDECGPSEPEGVSVPPFAPCASESRDNSGDDEADNERDADWKPDENDEEQGVSECDTNSSTTTQKGHVKTKIRKLLRSSPGARTEGVESCKVCGSLRLSMNILIKHAWSHVDDPQRLCGVCGECAESAEELRSHLQNHLKTHICNICGRCFISVASLKRHTTLHTGEKRYKCDICNKAYTHSTGLKSHQWEHMESKPYKCDICHQSFGYKQQMIIHTRTHTGEKPYRCNVCGKSFSYLKFLSAHKSVHTGQKHHACQVCGKRFATLEKRKSHEKIHTVREKSYLCDVCCKTFHSQGQLNHHLKTHSNEKIVCSECGKGLSSLGALKRHMTIHTGDRPYSCSECGRAFKCWSTLGGHMRTHSGEKRFVCGICDKACARLEHLKVHMRTHSGERPYKCTLCDKAFTQSHCLKTHIKSHQGEQKS